MSASPLTSLLFDHGPQPPPPTSTPSNMHLRPSINGAFSGLKKKLSRRSSNRMSRRDNSPEEHAAVAAAKRVSDITSFLSPQSNSPLTSGSPATRRSSRPGMSAFTTPSNEPPPAYTPTPGPSNTVSTQPAIAPLATTTGAGDDPFDFLKTFDTIFLIDDSASMKGPSWAETEEALKTITPICTERDADGIDIYFLNHTDSFDYKNVTSVDTVVDIFKTIVPDGATPTGQRLNKILRPYLTQYEAHPDTTKPINIIVITDGEPTDDVESPIIAAAKKLDKLDAPAWQVGIQFFQVGKEPGAQEHLKELDNGLSKLAGGVPVRDIVDTVPFTGQDGAELTGIGVLKVVLGSVSKRWDRRSKDLHRK